MHYRIQDGRASVVSYGRDGAPGGDGPDRDLTNADTTLPPPSFPEFLRLRGSAPAVGVSVLAGEMAFLLAWALVDPEKLSRRGAVALVLKLAFTLIAAAAVGACMALLERPSGH